MPSATLVISITQIINKLYFLTVADDLHERIWAEMITTNGAGRDRIASRTVKKGKKSDSAFRM